MEYDDIYDEEKCRSASWEFAGNIFTENPYEVVFFVCA